MATKTPKLSPTKIKAKEAKQTKEPTEVEEADVSLPKGVLDEATLTSWGLNKRSNAFKALLGQDVSTPEGLDLMNKTLEANKGKIDEAAVEDYLKGIQSGQTISKTIRISDEVPGGQVYGTPGGVEGRYGFTTPISGIITQRSEARKEDVDTSLKETKLLNQSQKNERLLSIQELLNDPNPNLRREARRKFIEMFKAEEAKTVAEEEAKVAQKERDKYKGLKKTEYPIEEQSKNLANILNTLQDKPTYLIQDLKNTDVSEAERAELNQHARDYLLTESLRNRFKTKLTEEERAALEEEGKSEKPDSTKQPDNKGTNTTTTTTPKK